MSATVTPSTVLGTDVTGPVSPRDRAVLAAVAAGRAEVRAGALLIDGRYSADQFALARLARAGLLTPGTARLTATGTRVLQPA
ncbi:hypothetical protein [Actinomycetospora chlora]